MEALGYMVHQEKLTGFVSNFFFFCHINIGKKEGSPNKNVSTLELLNLVQQV